MSGGFACDCAERKKKDPMDRDWVVIDRYCNYSAFSGYRRTSSDYSCVHCRSCGHFWRTKADYVDLIPNGTWKDKREGVNAHGTG